MASTLVTKLARVAHAALTREAAKSGHLRYYEIIAEFGTVTEGRCSCTSVRSSGLRDGRKHVTGKISYKGRARVWVVRADIGCPVL